MPGRRAARKAVVLLSGGLDSATTLAIARAAGYRPYAITIDYQQRHARELASARSIAAAFRAEKHLIVDFNLRDIGGSALTADIAVPKGGLPASGRAVGRKRLPRQEAAIPVTYVPARNTIFLSFALAWAEVLRAETIFIGANAVDYSGYPDCRPEYLRAFEAMANLATKVAVEGELAFHIEAPLLAMTKAEIIRKGTELGVDYGLTWSCYDPRPVRQSRAAGEAERAYVPCRRCDSCRLRSRGFRAAGMKDPLL